MRTTTLIALAACFLCLPLAAQTPPAEGLALWLKPDAGVTADASGAVSLWADQTSNGNNAGQRAEGSADELPHWIANAVNGKPVVRFDGVDDVLEIVNSPSLQPLSGDWTVFFVAKRLTASQGGFPQIIGSRPWVAGLDKGWAVSFTTGGLIGSHLADGSSGHDVPTVLSATALSQSTFQVWQVEENRAAGTTKFYLSGAPDRTLQTAMPAGPVDQTDSIYLGREIGGANNRRANMDLAEVLIYNRVLQKADRDSVTGYLSDKYGLPFAPNSPPIVSLTSPAVGASFEIPADLTITAAATDVDGTVVKVEFFEGVRLIATAMAEPYRVPVSIQSTGSVTFTAVATDNLGERATSAPVTITLTGSPPPIPPLPTDGLQLRLSADAGVTSDASGSIGAWVDQSPNSHRATQDNAAAMPPDSFQPTLVPDALNAKPVVRFDGVDDFMIIPNSPSLQPLSGGWTVLFVGKRGPASRGDFPQIIGSRPWTAGLDKGWAITLDGAGLVASHLADGSNGHDAPAVRSGSALSADAFQVWQVEENRNAGSTAFYLFGELDRQLSPPMPAAAIDQPNDVYIGSEVEGGDFRRANIDLAEIAVYNRVLSSAERDAATTHFLRKYGITQLASRNQAPAVSLTSPSGGATFDAPAEITLSATASDSDGSIVRVEFFRGATSLGVATVSPYSLTGTISSAGDFALRAVATDNLGAITLSDPVNIKVTARGVKLIGKVDYSDSFTLNPPRRNGLYNDNSAGGYNVENTHGNPAATWTPQSNFSFNDIPGSFGSGPTVLAAAVGNPGAATGVAQSGGGDFSFTYGLRTDYIVEVDAFLSPGDRTDISSLPEAGNTIFAANSLTVFFRRDSIAGLPGIGLFNGAKETAVVDGSGNLVKTGVTDNDWHKLAVHFNQDQHRLRIFVDGILKADLDLTTFAEGIYQNYSNGAVGVGGAGAFVDGKVLWFDNFQVGAHGLGVAIQAESPPIGNTWDGFATIPGPSANDYADINSGHGVTFTLADGSTHAASSGPQVLNDGIFPATHSNVTTFLHSDAGYARVLIDLNQPAGQALLISEINTYERSGEARRNYQNYSLWGSSAPIAPSQVGTDPALNGWELIGTVEFVPAEQALGNKSGVHIGGINQGYRYLLWEIRRRVGGTEASPQYVEFDIVAAEEAARLTIVRSAEGIVINWTGTGTLEEAGAVTGPWTTVAGAASPFTVTPTAQQKFYRLRQ